MINPIIKAEAFHQLSQTQNLILIDARFVYSNYEKGHLDGALHVDLNKDLSQIVENPAHGGRHPLPSPAAFGSTLGKLGITPESHVIVYDDKNASMSAARFWWMLKALGHEKVQVLDGGFQAAEKQGFLVNNEIATPQSSSPYPVTDWKSPLADLTEVKSASGKRNQMIIDVRESERYQGLKEPIDKIAGHIPGAINLPFTENLDENGSFLSQEKLKEKYLKAFKATPSSEIIVHCGSGVTACHTLLAITFAGLDIPKLYVGSWSEWSRNNLPMVTES
ncbi:sulfurtransferase [Cyclobacterium qasimii]|nr:sulfurtransferase [Cyclobacterium qasimii]